MPSRAVPDYLRTMIDRFVKHAPLDLDGNTLNHVGQFNNVKHVSESDGVQGLVDTLDELGETPGTVVVDPGTYPVNDNLVIPSNTELVGSGMFGGTTIKLADDSDLSLAGTIRVEGERVSVRQLEIDGNKQENTFTDSQEHCFYTSGADRVLVDRVRAHNAVGYGIDPHDDPDDIPTTNILVTNCVAENNDVHGITFAGVQNGVIDNCLSINNNEHGIDLTDQTGSDITVSNCHSYNNADHGLVIHNGTTDVTINGGYYASNAGGMRFGTSAEAVDNITVSDALIKNNAGYGLNSQGCTKISVSGCQFVDNASETGNAELTMQTPDDRPTARVSIQGCHFDTSVGATFGIDERTGSGPNVVVGCTFGPDYSTAVDLEHADSESVATIVE